jgi:hypothetical protein
MDKKTTASQDREIKALEMAHDLGIDVTLRSKEIRQELNKRGYYWFPSARTWQQLGAPTYDYTSAQRQQRRTQQKNKIAQDNGFDTWAKLETAVLNGAAVISVKKTE